MSPAPLPGWVACVPRGAQATFALVEGGGAARPRLAWLAREDWSDPALTLRRLRRPHGLHRRRMVTVLDRQAYQLHTLDAPEGSPREEWPAATRWRLKDVVDFPVDRAAVDVLEVPASATARHQRQLIAVAAPHEQLRPLVEAAHEAGAPWSAIDVPETALRNLCALTEPPGRGQALLHVDAQRTVLAVTAGGELLTSRQFEATLPQLAGDDTDDDAQARRTATWDRLGLELQRTLDGFERLFSPVALARLIVTPTLPSLIEHLRQLLDLPVQPYDGTEVIDLGEVQADTLDADHWCAIGAALRGP